MAGFSYVRLLLEHCVNTMIVSGDVGDVVQVTGNKRVLDVQRRVAEVKSLMLLPLLLCHGTIVELTRQIRYNFKGPPQDLSL